METSHEDFRVSRYIKNLTKPPSSSQRYKDLVAISATAQLRTPACGARHSPVDGDEKNLHGEKETGSNVGGDCFQ